MIKECTRPDGTKFTFVQAEWVVLTEKIPEEKSYSDKIVDELIEEILKEDK